MTGNIRIGPVSIYQDIEISLTEHFVPPVVHVKQYDHMARKVRCTLFYNKVEYPIPTDVILVYSGTRPDGRIFRLAFNARKYTINMILMLKSDGKSPYNEVWVYVYFHYKRGMLL